MLRIPNYYITIKNHMKTIDSRWGNVSTPEYQLILLK
jgi:hypothetical protein